MIGEAIIIRSRIDDETIHVVDPVDAVAIIAQRHLPAKPVEDVGVLVHQRIAEAHVGDLGEHIGIQQTLRRPEHGIAVDVGAVDSVESGRSQIHVILIERRREIRQRVIRISTGHQHHVAVGHGLPDHVIESRAGTPLRTAVLDFGPLQRRGQRRRDVQVERLLEDVMALDGPLITRARAIVDDVMDDVGRLDGLIAVGQQRNLGGLAHVVVGIPADPLG